MGILKQTGFFYFNNLLRILEQVSWDLDKIERNQEV